MAAAHLRNARTGMAKALKVKGANKKCLEEHFAANS